MSKGKFILYTFIMYCSTIQSHSICSHFVCRYHGVDCGVDLTVTINDIHIIDDVFAVIKLLQKRHPTIVTTATCSYRHSAISSASA